MIVQIIGSLLSTSESWVELQVLDIGLVQLQLFLTFEECVRKWENSLSV